MSTITLTNPSVNSGVAVTLDGSTNATYNWRSLTNVTPSPSSFSLVPVDISGFENPTIVVNGVFDVDNIGSSELTHALLLQFAKVPYGGTASTATTLSVGTGNSATDTYLLATDAVTTSIRVVIESFQIDLDRTSDKLHIWNYTINMRETK